MRMVNRLLMVAAMGLLSNATVFAAGEQTTTEKKAVDFLLTQQSPDGSWLAQAGPAVTALVVKGLIQAGHSPGEPAVQRGLDFIEKTHQADGGFYVDSHATYNTAITLTTLGTLPEPARSRFKEQIKEAQDFLKSIQSGAPGAAKDSDGKTVTADHPWFGGWGYGEGATLKAGRRPDLSNSHFVIEALRTSGVPASDPSIQNALVFLSREQAYEGNAMPWAKGRTDGGFIYSMGFNQKHNFYGESEGPDSKDRDGNEILTTYGSMTYAGLKSLLYADVKKDDPRVQAALRWITGNYTLDVNPGLNSEQGLFYYYHTFAAALNAYGQDTITDAKGVKHEWRKEFEAAMAAHQKPDGSYVNPADRWMESNPVLVTSYVVLSLQDARGL
jgi:squalene-hopene/tetraprenyl-beta-curcumene cyclase